ncbi:hypothetical protein M2302_002912 [Micromonospora sp. A200]|uniref:DUF1579 family protein n=1 Tax=Micromonospora sp. A200 TaxID=2940568 RepID=UPI002474AB23|nr:DUF1579 family protein [Micromonospora sp. A200]MDH6462732.1 hypothetical protein [Micromonospora sp. A200]
MSDNTEFQMPKPDPALGRLNFLVGTWTLAGSTVPGPMGPATEVTGWETCEWLDGGFFLLHRWETRFEVGGHEVRDTGYEFCDYDPAAGEYRTHFFNSLGPYDASNSHYSGGFDGDALVVTGPARITRRPNGDGTVTVDSDIPTGDGTWLPMMSYLLTRSA